MLSGARKRMEVNWLIDKYRVFFWCDGNNFITWYRWWLHTIVNLLNDNEFYTLKELFLCWENFTSIEKRLQFSSVAQSCPTLCDPMNRSTPGLLVHHQLPEFTQTHIHWVVMPPSHLILCRPLLLLPPSIRVFSNESTLRMRWPKVLEFQLQHHSFQRNPRANLLQNGLDGSPCSPRDSQKSSPTPQFKSINSLALSFLHNPTLTSIHDHWKNYSLD